jgi:beta-N-acetylhexosaminidase
MKKWKTLSLSLLLLSFLSAGCGGQAQSNPTQAPSPSAHPTPTTAPTSAPTKTSTPAPTASDSPGPGAIDPYAETIAAMSIREKIGQMVIVGLDGTKLSAQTKKMITDYHVGGFILYKDNITSVAQTVALLNGLKETNADNPAGLWLSVDQEGGKVSRMPDQLVKTPTAASIGKVNDAAYTQAIGEAIGEQLLTIGFNMDFAPVLDINSNPKNPVIGDRSFASKPEGVITHGITMMNAIRSRQVATVVKHFPGHGDTAVDSHKELPVVNKSLAELERFELLPFQAAVNDNADAIMIAHLLIPQIDQKYPASISKELITGLLREEWGYDGVIMTDDMMMGGITKNFKIGQAAVKSVLAGSDILLIGHDAKQQIALLKALQKSVEAGEISERRLDESVRRILRLKAAYKVKDTSIQTPDIDTINQQIKAALQLGEKG